MCNKITLTAVFSLLFALLVGCSSGPNPQRLASIDGSKLRLMQEVLNKTPNDGTGYWRLNDRNFGLVTVDATYKKEDTVCRLVKENEVIAGEAKSSVSSYCRKSGQPWRR